MRTTGLLAILLLMPFAYAQEPNPCDVEVGHPSDPRKVGPGKSSSEVRLQIAVPACRKAVEQEPDNPRLNYQLGRALVYWADINQADTDEGVAYVQKSADMDYPQALFVLGLMHKRTGEDCLAEPVTKRAADLALKSARLTYVSDALSGAYDGCITVDKATMMSYLEQAKAQVSGYYENMLVASLMRELEASEL